MKRRTVIRAGLLLTSVCLAAWMLPAQIEKVMTTMGWASRATGGTSDEAGLGKTRQRRVGGGGGAVILSPRSRPMTPEEAARLAAQAQRLAPIPYEDKTPRNKSGSPVDPLALIDEFIGPDGAPATESPATPNGSAPATAPR